MCGCCSEAQDGKQDNRPVLSTESLAPRGQLVFGVGVGALLFVPVFKSLTGLPPYLGMLLGLGALWILTDAIHYGESDRQKLKVPQALSRIDTQGVLFFLGILLSVGRSAFCEPHAVRLVRFKFLSKTALVCCPGTSQSVCGVAQLAVCRSSYTAGSLPG